MPGTWAWGLGRVSKGLGAGAWRGLRGWGQGGGWTLEGRDGRTFARLFARSFGRSDGRTKNSPLCSIGHRPLRVRCPKSGWAALSLSDFCYHIVVFNNTGVFIIITVPICMYQNVTKYLKIICTGDFFIFAHFLMGRWWLLCTTLCLSKLRFGYQ